MELKNTITKVLLCNKFTWINNGSALTARSPRGLNSNRLEQIGFRTRKLKNKMRLAQLRKRKRRGGPLRGSLTLLKSKKWKELCH